MMNLTTCFQLYKWNEENSISFKEKFRIEKKFKIESYSFQLYGVVSIKCDFSDIILALDSYVKSSECFANYSNEE